MSPTTAEQRGTARRGAGPREPGRAGPSRRSGGRGHGRPSRPRGRRLFVAFVALMLIGAGAAGLAVRDNNISDAVRELTLPLRHEDVIRQQAAQKNLDPALIAAIIYEESRFRDATSHAGAKGLMQIVPSTARFIAARSGGTAFELRDLATPQVNIAYGSWYMRYLLDRYGGNEELAVAAYNAGEQNVDRWVARAGGADRFKPVEHIAFPETRHYVEGVMRHRDEYRRHYGDELGL